MKYCLSARQDNIFLAKADQICVKWRDKKALIEFAENFPNADLILEIQPGLGEEIDWKYIAMCAKKANNLYCKLYNLVYCDICKEYNLKFFYAYPATSFYELNGLQKIGVSYIYVGAPIFFQQNKLKEYNIPIRYVPNLAFNPYIPTMNGVHGAWFRPEDIDLYDFNESVCEFHTNNLEQEKLTYEIYKERKEWPGELNLLIYNLNKETKGRIVDEKFGQIRLNCGQKCESLKNCYLCDLMLNFETTLHKYKKRLENTELSSAPQENN